MENFFDYIIMKILDFASCISIECISSCVALCVNIMLLLVAIWTWRRTFYKKISFIECFIKYEKFKPFKLNIGIENKALVPISIKNAILILDNKYYISILDENKDDLFVLNALKSDYIVFSYTSSPEYEITHLLDECKIKTLFIKLIGGYEISVGFNKSSSKNTFKHNPYRLTKIRTSNQYLNGEMLSNDVLYIASILEENTQNLTLIYIDSKGIFNRPFYEFNRIPIKENGTEELVQERFQEMIDNESPKKYLVSVKNRILFYAGSK